MKDDIVLRTNKAFHFLTESLMIFSAIFMPARSIHFLYYPSDQILQSNFECSICIDTICSDG